MKIALMAAAAMLATPLMAQMAPQTTPPAGQTTTAPQTDSNGPTNPVDSSSQTGTSGTTTSTTAPMAPNSSMASSSAQSSMAPMTTDSSAPMPAANGNLPWCRQGQYTGCREHENAMGQGVHRRRR